MHLPSTELLIPETKSINWENTQSIFTRYKLLLDNYYLAPHSVAPSLAIFESSKTLANKPPQIIAELQEITHIPLKFFSLGKQQISRTLSDDFTLGRSQASKLIDEGFNLLGISFIPSKYISEIYLKSIIAKLLDKEPASLVNNLRVTKEQAWLDQIITLRNLILTPSRNQPTPEFVNQVLAHLAGFITEATYRKTPLIIDSLFGLVAALIAEKTTPRINNWLILAQTKPDDPAFLAIKNYLRIPIWENYYFTDYYGISIINLINMLENINKQEKFLI